MSPLPPQPREPRPLFGAMLLVATLLPGCSKKADSTAAPLTVAAASDLAFAFKDVGEAFEKKTGRKVTFSFGSTGLLAKQIAEGAPFDVFAAANVDFADEVVKQGVCFADSKALYARGRIVLWTKRNAPRPTTILDLKDPKFVKIAVANPEHAPYGRAAKQAMIKAGVWDTVSSRMVYGENIQQTLQFAQSGNVEVAIVALSLAIASDGSYAPIDQALHEPIDQALVVCKGAGGRADNAADGRRFTLFVNSEEGRAIMKRHGFLLPGESQAQATPPDAR